MSTPPETVTEEQVQEDLIRLDAYRNQLQASLQQHQILTASRADHVRARESLEGVERAGSGDELLIPLGGETLVRGTIARESPILIGMGSGIVVEMERPKAMELLSERLVKIDQAIRELEGQMNTLEERIQLLSRRLDSLSRAPVSGDVGGD